jgi:hypothetical protein
MADYRTISVGFWHDEYTETLNATERLFYIYLFTNPHLSNAGVLKITPRKMAFETGIDDVRPCIERLKADGKLMEVDGFYWTVNFIRHQTSNSPKIVISIMKSLRRLPEALSEMIRGKYPAIEKASQKGIDTVTGKADKVSIPYQYPIDTTPIPTVEYELESEPELEEKKNIPSARQKSRFRDEGYSFSDWFAQNLKPDSIKFNNKAREEWSMVWYRLRETDGRSSEADKAMMLKAIEWARNNEFWKKYFRTPMKLRKKNPDGEMYIDVFIEQMKDQKLRRANVQQTNDQHEHVYTLPTPLTRGE